MSIDQQCDPKLKKELEEIRKNEIINDKKSSEYRGYFRSDLGEMKLYFNTVNNFIKDSEKSDVKELEQFANYDDYWADNYPYWWRDMINPRFMSSFVLMAVGCCDLHFELLTELAYLINGIERQKVVKPINFATRKMDFEKFHIGIKYEKEWNFVVPSYDVRSSLVHTGGYIGMCLKTTKQKLIDNAEKLCDIMTHDNEIIEINEKYCLELTESIDALINGICDDIDICCDGLRSKV